MNALRKAALGQFERLAFSLALGRGIPVFPCSPLTKKPLVESGFKAATEDLQQLVNWTKQHPNAMVGIPTGKATGFWVLDIDAKRSGIRQIGEEAAEIVTGYHSLRALEQKFGPLPRSMRVRTGGGGLHVYFRMPPGVRIPQRASDIAPGIDVRGSTGYVIAVDSTPSDGNVYQAIDGTSYDDIEPAPDWLLFLAVFNKRRREQLAKIGVQGPKDLGCEPWQWADRSRELLKLERPKLQGELTEGRAESIRNYVRKGIAGNIEAVRGADPGSRDTTINNVALLSWSLLRGAAEIGVKVDDVAEQAYSDFFDAVASHGGEFENVDYTEDKWTRAEADADPRDLGHVGAPKPEEEFGDVLALGSPANDASAKTITASTFVPEDCSKIPPRDWVYGHHYIRKFLSVTVAPGSTGKSSLQIAEALAMASGKPLLGFPVKEPLRVWYINLEDPADELRRRFNAACKRYGLSAEDLGDRLKVDTGRNVPICIAKDDRKGFTIVDADVQALIREIRSNRIDVLILDPFVALHDVSENDNSKIEHVVRKLAEIAEETNCAIEVAHHVRKNREGGEVTSDDARGGSAFMVKMRSSRTLNRMSEKDAARFGISPEKSPSYFRTDRGDQSNLVPATKHSVWFQMEGVLLGNSRDGLSAGDSVGVAVRFEPQLAEEQIPADALQRIWEKIRDGEWRADKRAANWAGHAVAEVLGWDIESTKPTIADLLEKWRKAGWFKTVTKPDKNRNMRTFLCAVEPLHRSEETTDA